MKTCPYCAEEIQDAAILCRYCHSELREPVPARTAPAARPPALPRYRVGPGWLWWMTTAGFVAGVFAVLQMASQSPAWLAQVTDPRVTGAAFWAWFSQTYLLAMLIMGLLYGLITLGVMFVIRLLAGKH